MSVHPRFSVGFVIALVFIAVLLVPSPARAASVSFVLVSGRTDGWNDSTPGGLNPTLSVRVGDLVTVTILYLYGIDNFAIYPEGTPPSDVVQGSPLALVRSLIVSEARPSTSVTFTIDVAGSYEYYSETRSAYLEYEVATHHGIFNVLPADNDAPVLGPITMSFPTPMPEEIVTFTSEAHDLDGDSLAFNWSFFSSSDGAEGIQSGATGPGGGTLVGTHAFGIFTYYYAQVVVGDGRGARASFQTGFFRVDCCGQVRLTTVPSVSSTISVDGIPRNDWELFDMKLGWGVHSVSYGDVPGYGTPAPSEFFTPLSYPYTEPTLVVAAFTPLGHVHISTDPPVPATVSVDGIPRNDWNVDLALPPGTHVVSFGGVTGYDPPTDVTVQVVAQQETTVTGRYKANPAASGPSPMGFGLLRISTSPAVRSRIDVGNVPRSEWGLSWLKLPPGTYLVAFSGVPGFTAPDPKVITVVANETTEVVGEFRQDGYLRVMTNPPQAVTIFVDGVPRNDWGAWLALPPGTYTVSFGTIGATPYVAWPPPPQQAVVTAGETTVVVGSPPATAPLATQDAAEPSRGGASADVRVSGSEFAQGSGVATTAQAINPGDPVGVALDVAGRRHPDGARS